MPKSEYQAEFRSTRGCGFAPVYAAISEIDTDEGNRQTAKLDKDPQFFRAIDNNIFQGSLITFS